MPQSISRPLQVFLCHSSGDKPTVRELYWRLDSEGWIDAWLDEEKLYPGQDWNYEIELAVEAADVIIVCLTKNSVTKEGYIQRELRKVLDQADYKPEGTLFIIPVRLEECEPPRRLRQWQYADYFPQNDRDRAYGRLLESLRMRAMALGIPRASTNGNQEHHKEPERYSGKGDSQSSIAEQIIESPVSTHVSESKRTRKIHPSQRNIGSISIMTAVLGLITIFLVILITSSLFRNSIIPNPTVTATNTLVLHPTGTLHLLEFEYPTLEVGTSRASVVGIIMRSSDYPYIVRDGPGAAYQIIDTVSQGMYVLIIGISPDRKWFYISYYYLDREDKLFGWIEKNFVEILEGDFELLPMLNFATPHP